MPIDEDKKTEEPAAVPETGKKAIILKWALVGVIQLLFVGLMIAISMFFVNSMKNPPKIDIAKQRQDSLKNEYRKQTERGETLATPIEVTVNIIGEDNRYVKCGVQLEYDPSYIKLGEELEARKVRIKSTVIDVMSSSTLSDLMSNEGKKEIRKRIVDEVNAILPDSLGGKKLGKISNSYFDSFMIQ
jgi:flagellar basal body-associated protein FliL